jgi:hypothetical protein
MLTSFTMLIVFQAFGGLLQQLTGVRVPGR